jgi:hypothetical protein
LGIAAYFILLISALSCHAQTISYKDTTLCVDTTAHLTRTIVQPYDSTWTKCVTVPIPVITPSDQRGMYVILDDVISDTAKFFKYCRQNTVNIVSFYARAYLQSTTKSKTIAAVFENIHRYGIKSSVDVRGSNELVYWENFFATYTGSKRPDAMTTEKEPYITGDYVGMYALLRDASRFCKKFGIELIVYMGHPTQQCWDSIVYYANRIWLSNYITMTVYNRSTGLWDYVDGRWTFIMNSAKKFSSLNYPVSYIISLEKKTLGAGNDFMADAYINQLMYGKVTDQAKALYESKASPDVKKYTDLVGTIIFYEKYAKQIILLKT